MPAELLDLPRWPVDDFPGDPYSEPHARERSLRAAKSRATAYADGEVKRVSSMFRVDIVVRASSEQEIGRGSGEGRGLYEAIRSAMDPLVTSGALPRAAGIDSEIATWSRTSNVEANLSLLDLTLAMAQTAGNLPAECEHLDAQAAELAEVAPFLRWICAYTLGLSAPRLEPSANAPQPRDLPVAYALHTRTWHVVHHIDDGGIADSIHRFFEHEPSPWGKSLFAATESCLRQGSDAKRAHEMALRAVQMEPKNPDGLLCSPWRQLLAVTRDTASAGGVARAMQAWAPWDANAWLMEVPMSSDRALSAAQRAYVLSPFDTHVADILGGRLLVAGAREGARDVALALLQGVNPVHRVESDLLLLRVDTSEARFDNALERARGVLNVAEEDAGLVLVQRLDVAWRAIEIGAILGRGSEIADATVTRFIDSEWPSLGGLYLSGAMRLPAICALASKRVSARCFSRLAALRAGFTGGMLPGTEAFTRGAERYAKGDIRGAADAWRPLLRDPGMLAGAMPDAMAETFERSGDLYLAERIDALEQARAGEFNGATLAHVRGARRAAARRDREETLSLAQRVIDAWSVADARVPAVEEMRKLVAALR